MINLDFHGQVLEWVLETEARMLAVFRMSSQEVIREMSTTRLEGGRLPILTGNLRRSLLVSTAAMPPRASGDVRFESSQDYGLVIASAQLGDKIFAGFQAAYAHRQEYGFVGVDSMGRHYNVSGKHFVGSAALRWPQIVAEQAAKLQGAAMARGGGAGG